MEKVTDKTEALSAIKNETLALENVSDELKADKEVVMAAVKNDVCVMAVSYTHLTQQKKMIM